jgi:hypothetical protein
MQIFRGIWPVTDVDSCWQDDWKSFPLPELEDIGLAASAAAE